MQSAIERKPAIISFCLSCLVGCTALSCRAQEEALPKSVPAAASPVAAAVAPPRDNLRDPFWPVDYVRPMLPGEPPDSDSAPEIGETEWRKLEKVLHEMVRGVSRLPTRSGGEEYLMLINGKVVAVGDVVSLSANGKNYRWKVTSISLRNGPVFERITTAQSAPPSPKK